MPSNEMDVYSKLFKLFSGSEAEVLSHAAVIDFHASHEDAFRKQVPSKAYSKRLVALLQKPGKKDCPVEVLPAVLLVTSTVSSNPASLKNLLQEDLGKCVNEVRGSVCDSPALDRRTGVLAATSRQNFLSLMPPGVQRVGTEQRGSRHRHL
jgi:hypothetical protein